MNQLQDSSEGLELYGALQLQACAVMLMNWTKTRIPWRNTQKRCYTVVRSTW